MKSSVEHPELKEVMSKSTSQETGVKHSELQYGKQLNGLSSGPHDNEMMADVQEQVAVPGVTADERKPLCL